MSELPSKLEDLDYNSVSVERAELRNGKIIIVIKPKLLSNQTFAVSPYYDEGDAKNQLQEASFNITVCEKGGDVKCNVGFSSGLGHFTKGRTQIHCGMSKLLFSKVDLAAHEILTCDDKYLFDEDRMSRLIKNLKLSSEKEWAKSLICSRKDVIKKASVTKAKDKLMIAIAEYESSLSDEFCGIVEGDSDDC